MSQKLCMEPWPLGFSLSPVLALRKLSMVSAWWCLVSHHKWYLTSLCQCFQKTTTHILIRTTAVKLSREPKRFIEIQINTDRFHEDNPITCSKSFLASKYDSLHDCNTEACEQMNHTFRKLASTTTYMNPKLYMKSLNLFFTFQNLNELLKNWSF